MLTALVFAALMSQQPVFASECANCDKMSALAKSGDLDREIGYLSQFKFSTQPELIEMEADAVTKLALSCIKRDAQSDSREMYYGIFNLQPVAMAAARMRLPRDQRNYLTNIYEETKRLFKNGNG